MQNTKYLKKKRSKAYIKGTLSGVRQFLATESPLKMMKECFLFYLKSSFHSQDT